MSDTIVCQGCGVAVPIPDDYARNKMQCPECGVMCPVPPRPPAKKKAVTSAPAEEEALFEDAAATPPTTTYSEKPLPAGKGVASCPHCGEVVRVADRKGGRRGKCPACRADWPAPAARPKPVPPPMPVPPPPDEFAGSSPDEDPDSSNPYRTSDAGSRRCPGCSDKLGPEVVVCVRCGFDLRIGRKAIKEYQKLERSWDSGMSLWTRILLFLLCQGAALSAIGVGFMTLDVESQSVEVTTFALSWIVYTVMTAFLLGTYDHIDLKRFKSGKVDLIRAWRICFAPLAPQKIDVREYFGVVGGGGEHAGFWEWLVFLILFGSGVVPALVYWYCAIYQTEYYVALTGEHGTVEVKVYRGWSKERMEEIQEALRTAMTV